MNFKNIVSIFFTIGFFTNITNAMEVEYADQSDFRNFPHELIATIMYHTDFDSINAFRCTSKNWHNVIGILYPSLFAKYLDTYSFLPSYRRDEAIFSSFQKYFVIFKPNKIVDHNTLETLVEFIDSTSFDRYQIILEGNFAKRHNILTPCSQGFYMTQKSGLKLLTIKNSDIEVTPCLMDIQKDVHSMAFNDKTLLVQHKGPGVDEGLNCWDMDNQHNIQPRVLLENLNEILCFGDKFIAPTVWRNAGFLLIDPNIDELIEKKISYPESESSYLPRQCSIDIQQDALASCVWNGHERYFYISDISKVNHKIKEIKIFSEILRSEVYECKGLYLKNQYLFLLNSTLFRNQSMFTIFNIYQEKIVFQKKFDDCTFSEKFTTEMYHVEDILFIPTHKWVIKVADTNYGKENQCHLDENSHRLLAINIGNYV